MKDAWPQVLDRVGKAKRSAWIVAMTATVRDFGADNVLRLSFPSRKDADDFKQLTAGEGVSSIVRQAISDVLGVTVKFIAQVDPGTPDGGSGGQGGGGPVEPAAGPSAPAVSTPREDQPEARPAGRPGSSTTSVSSTPSSPAGSASASPGPAAATGVVGWNVVAIPDSDGTDSDGTDSARPGSAGPVIAADAVRAMESERAAAPSEARGLRDDLPDYFPDESEAPPPDEEPPFPDPGPGHASAMIPPRAAPHQPPAAVAPPASAPQQRSVRAATAPTAERLAPAPDPARTTHPAGVSRYGESVVRELLGATFIEEQPHTPRTGFNR